MVSSSRNFWVVHNMNKTGLLFLLTLFMAPAWAQLDEVGLLNEEIEPIVSPVVDNPIEVTIKEWPVPWKDSRPRDPDVAPNGVIWLVGQGGDYAARFDPASEEFTSTRIYSKDARYLSNISGWSLNKIFVLISKSSKSITPDCLHR